MNESEKEIINHQNNKSSFTDGITQDEVNLAEASGSDKMTGDNYQNNLEIILDIPLEITIELGRTRMVINDLIKLAQGSVIELSKLSGETLEVFANQRLIAKGEVVSVNDKYGLRIIEIISPMERIKSLK